MKTFPMNLYQLIAFGLAGENWQQFVDNYNKKYDAEIIDGFKKTPLQMDYTFSQLIGNIGATTLPAYVDPESAGYEKALKAVQGAIGNIPTMKAFYSLNRSVLQKRLALINRVGNAALDSEMQECFLGLIDESTDGLIQSYYNALTNQRMRIVSTGSFVIDDENNPRGIQGIEIKFNIPASNFLKYTATSNATKRWWTDADHTTEGADADPIKDLKDRIKYIRNTAHVGIPMHIEMSKKLLEDLYTHTAVLKRIGYVLTPLASSDAIAIQSGRNLSDEQIKAQIERLIGMRIVAQDSVAWVDKPNASTHTLDQVEVKNFEEKNVSFIPDGNIGEIQAVNVLTLGYDADKVASHDGGRLVLTQRANPETHSIYIESESAILCVPTAVKQMFISTYTA